MRKLAAVMVLALFSVLVGCSEETNQNVVTTDDLKKRRAELAAKRKGKEKMAAKAPAAAHAAQGASTLDKNFGEMGAEYSYDPREKRDPFRSFLLAAKERSDEEAGPLADYELGQLKPVAIVWDGNAPKAMIVDPRGRTHILSEGSPVGKNRGRVIHIGDNLILVKETYVDFAGEESTNDVELRIRGSQGG